MSWMVRIARWSASTRSMSWKFVCVSRMPCMKVRFAKPLIDQSDIDAVAQSLKQRILTNGGNVMQFEERFVEHIGGGIAVAVSSCTSALYIAMKCLDIFHGYEVIVPALS